MWYFMAGIESMEKQVTEQVDFGLLSFYAVDKQHKFDKVEKKINHILMDSGAYSFRHGARVDFDEFCNRYVEFIKNNDSNEKIVGFFELDIDNIVGYEKVLEYRKKLESVSDKIIPVWHNNRGINEFIKMCKDYSGKRVAVATVGWHDMYPSQLNMFINTAHKYNCKIHVLGMTKKELIRSLNLGLEDSFDSVAWVLLGAFGRIHINYEDDKIYSFESLHNITGLASTRFTLVNFLVYRRLQEYYKYIDQSVPIT